jgi:hypothetical protein
MYVIKSFVILRSFVNKPSKSLCSNGFVIPFNKLSWYLD